MISISGGELKNVENGGQVIELHAIPSNGTAKYVERKITIRF
jgi:hypothetical protein